LERLKCIAHEVGAIQVIFGGKAHPRDEDGKALIRRVYEAASELRVTIKVVYLEEDDMTLGALLCGGVASGSTRPEAT
jgi:glycogen phosphorylase